jgi:putative hemolysin
VNPALQGLLVFLGLLLVSAFLSAGRSALANVRRLNLRDLAEDGNRRAARALDVAEDSARLLSTVQIAQTGLQFLMAAAVVLLLAPGVIVWLRAAMPTIMPIVASVIGYGLCIALAGLADLLLGGFLPETLAQRNAEDWAIGLGGPMRLVVLAIAPFARLIMRLNNLLSGPPDGQAATLSIVTEEEIMTLVDAGEEEGVIKVGEKEMIYSIFQLDQTLAREVMVPRIDVVATEVGTPLPEALDLIIKVGHSRIPVYEGSLDNIRGLLYAKDLLEVWRQGKDEIDLSTILRPALFTPESKPVSDLLRELQQAKVHMAVVVDEYGGTAGLVTIEDIVEEIVGEIQDEYDAEEAPFEKIGEDEFVFDARIDLDDFNYLLDVELPTEMGDTLAGFIYSQLGKVPDAGDELQADGLHIQVLSVKDRRIRKVRVRRLPPADSQPPGDRNEHDKR